jgi:uncharacterized Zn finger protein (UPF0148 family)
METETLTVAERTCKDCGTPLGAGRDDRMYCDEACKTNFNNRKKRETEKQVWSRPDSSYCRQLNK